MSATVKLITIGNSQGIRLPKELIRRYQFDKEIRIIETPQGILLQPMETAKLSWKETFQELAQENKVELTDWDATLGDGLPAESFEGWTR
jgi:antitoxin MazE